MSLTNFVLHTVYTYEIHIINYRLSIESYVPLDKSHFNLLHREHNVTSSLILIRIASEQIDMFAHVCTSTNNRIR